MEDNKKDCLSDSDIQRLAEELESRLVSKFYRNLGMGVWALVWKAIVGVIILVAIYGSTKGKGIPWL